jgi:amidophosphoribosyltransferase
MHEECGLFGVESTGEPAAGTTYRGLLALQHRGQESAGIAVADGSRLRLHKAQGLISEVFDGGALSGLKGHLALGHTRYSTMGSNRLENSQPIVAVHREIGPIAVGLNGNLTNAAALRHELEQSGVTFETSTDTELVVQLLARTVGPDLPQILERALPRVKGAYSLLILTRGALMGVRDPLGVRPLCLGKLPNSGWILASESCAVDAVGGQFVRDVHPGEALVLDGGDPRSYGVLTSEQKATCMFEFIYFARPDSTMEGHQLREARHNMGQELAREAPVDADVVLPIPNSGTAAATGYAYASGIPLSEALIQSEPVGRSFLQPKDRRLKVDLKLTFNLQAKTVRGLRVVVVDDSIVRGTTIGKVVQELRRAGVGAVHVRIGSPPIRWPCFMGIDIGNRSQLIASSHSVEEVGRLIGANSLAYLSKQGLFRALKASRGFCMACFTGEYPVPVPPELEMDKLAFEREPTNDRAAAAGRGEAPHWRGEIPRS